MSYAFSKLFWGFFLVLLEIHLFVIDVLPDPIGYLLIYLGINHLITEFPVGNKPRNIALILIFLSIPTVFIQQNASSSSMSQLSGWSVYVTILALLKLILVYYLFQLMMKIAHRYGDSILANRTLTTFRIYMISMLLIHIVEPFSMNFLTGEQISYVVISAMVGLIMEIVLLVLLRRYMKLDDKLLQSPLNV